VAIGEGYQPGCSVRPPDTPLDGRSRRREAVHEINMRTSLQRAQIRLNLQYHLYHRPRYRVSNNNHLECIHLGDPDVDDALAI